MNFNHIDSSTLALLKTNSIKTRQKVLKKCKYFTTMKDKDFFYEVSRRLFLEIGDLLKIDFEHDLMLMLYNNEKDS
jgi:hypothetical protein